MNTYSNFLCLLLATCLLYSCKQKEDTSPYIRPAYTLADLTGSRLFGGEEITIYPDDTSKNTSYHIDSFTLRMELQDDSVLLLPHYGVFPTTIKLYRKEKNFIFRDEGVPKSTWPYFESNAPGSNERIAIHFDQEYNLCTYYYHKHIVKPNTKGYDIIRVYYEL
ncbi:MAG: hypothetical protein R2800_04985 [Flavipsychrobacter sp.]